MKYYSEADSGPLRQAFEEEVLGWPGVGRRRMFGVPCYLATGKLFAFLVTDGIVITKLPQPDREALLRRFKATAFRSGDRLYRTWVRLSVNSLDGLDDIMPLVRQSYEVVCLRG
ncbi:MAG: DUF5519 family protein [Dehalococcoidia bacterium]|nr:DUF5519 family protein [Dehalococcoidia bacterium]MDP6783291.1 DUF5519 family protein [Dehalococcoidia bacterium]